MSLARASTSVACQLASQSANRGAKQHLPRVPATQPSHACLSHSCPGRSAIDWRAQPAQLRARAGVTVQAQQSGDVQALEKGKIVDVEEIKGVRVLIDDDGEPRAEYLVQWKDGAPDTWEPSSNLADNLLREFEERWWTAARTGDEETLRKLLQGGGRVLARAVDENGRSALHYAAALGRVAATRMLCEAGADVDVQDFKDGYTPLHMATGYLHTATIAALLEAGADPEVPDRQARSALALAEGLRERCPPNVPNMAAQRMALENCAAMLTDVLYEDVEPAAVLDVRVNEDGTKDYLMRWADEADDCWVAERYVSRDVIDDYEAGIEYTAADAVVDVRQKGDERTFKVRWLDGHPDTWEPEENVSPDLVAAFMELRQQQKEAMRAAAAAGQHGGDKGQEAASATRETEAAAV